MDTSNKVKGQCLCGSVSIKCTLQTDSFGACHCRMCCKWSGGPALAVEGKDVSFDGEEFISTFISSEWAERGFCKLCGTHLFYRLKSGEFINIPLGLLEGVDHLRFDMQIFIDKKPKHYNFSEKTEMMTEAEVFAKYVPS